MLFQIEESISRE